MKTVVWEQPSHPEGKRLLEARLKYFPIAHQKGGGKWGTRARQGVGVGDRFGSGSKKYRPPTFSLLKVALETGRKHQIRAQMSHIGHPIVGDAKYGSIQTLRDIPLHSYRLEFNHPTKVDTIMSFFSYPPCVWTPRYGGEIEQGVRSIMPHVEEEGEQLFE